jgi:DNA-directed RNA polymerase beta' subunit
MSKRPITSEEIEYVLQDIKPISGLKKEISNNIYKRMCRNFVDMLSGCEIYPDILDELRMKLTKQYYDSQISPGSSIGILTAQSIGENQTQLQLNSFHSAGISTATVVTGVPRFNELINATKNPKDVLTTIRLKDEYKTIQDIRDNAGIFIKHLCFRDVLVRTELFAESTELDEWYTIFDAIYSDREYLKEQYTHFIRCYLDLEILFLYKLRLQKIGEKLMESYDDIQCVWSPNTLGMIDIWLNTDNIVLPDGINIEYIKEDNKISIYTDHVVVPTLREITINGIEGIEQINYTIRPQTDSWFIEASGYNLQELLAQDIIDETQTLSNHMWEIFNVLGIEATREFLIQEFMNIISTDTFINLRHVQLLVDVMLYTGSISSISRYGVHKNQSGALTKCSFEESLEQILKAGIYGEKELINGVSGAIICGKVSNIGTGACDLIYKNPTI